MQTGNLHVHSTLYQVYESVLALQVEEHGHKLVEVSFA